MSYLSWTIICFFVISWYIIVTIIVAIRGGKDIKKMLKDLDASDDVSGFA